MTTAGLPEWGMLAGILVLAALLVGGTIAFFWRGARTWVIGKVAVAAGRPKAIVSLTADIIAGKKIATLMVQENPTLYKDQLFNLYGEVVTIGRGADNHIVVPGEPIARRHAEIRRVADKLWVFDSGSGQGTFVNDVRVGEEGMPIQDGDILSLGPGTTMILHTDQAQSAETKDKVLDAGSPISEDSSTNESGGR